MCFNTVANLSLSEQLKQPIHKRNYNEEHFTVSAPRYDIATVGLSLGQDAGWKRKLVSMLPDFSNPRCLDLACGTGDISFLLAKQYPKGFICGSDLTQEMLHYANMRNTYSNVSFCKEDMCSLQAKDSSVDIVTGSYALRNAPDLSQAVDEISRVLAPGGVAAFLDFAKANSSFKQRFQYYLLKFWGSFWGLALHANPAVHGYISESLKVYPSQDELAQLFAAKGLKRTEHQPLFGGMMAISVFEKQG